MWHLDPSSARWESARFSAAMELAFPSRGLQAITWDGAALADAALMQVTVAARGGERAERIEDAYIRGSDLIVTYAEASDSVVRPQVCWRVVHQPHAASGVVLEVLVSVQTQCLDSDPRVQVTSVLPGREWMLLTGGAAASDCRPVGWPDASPHTVDVAAACQALLARLPASACSYGHILTPSDLVHAQLSWDAARRATALETTYFAGRLEKGVLRRARSRAVLMPRAGDAELLVELLLGTVATAPPLTT